MFNCRRHSLPYFHLKQIWRYIANNSSTEWKPTIGLEIHAQLAVKSKLFSSGSTKYGRPTNSCVNLFDAAIPGSLPVLNKRAVELAVLASHALKCRINPVSLFDRKHYFYFDLPQGYQITQQRKPIAQNGTLDFAVFTPGIHKKPYYKTTKIKQIQLEQDSGKSYHMPGLKEAFIDLNRAGIALIEIVFEPDLQEAEEAGAVVKELCFILKEIGSCTCKMEEGALRVDVNVSVSKESNKLGVRTEIKNIGSIRGVVNAINYEIKRHINILENGGEIINQTLAWNSYERKTVLLRNKENVHDYRFMPEPNLPPLRIIVDEKSEKVHQDIVNKEDIPNLIYLKCKRPQLPQDKRNMLMKTYNMSDTTAFNIVNIPELYTYFIDIMSEDSSRDIQAVYNLLMNPLLKALNALKIDPSECTLSSSHIGELADMRGKLINDFLIYKIIEEILKGSKMSPKELVKEKGFGLLPDEEVEKHCVRVIEENPKIVKNMLNGNIKAKTLLINNVMKLCHIRTTGKTVDKLLMKLVEEKQMNGSSN